MTRSGNSWLLALPKVELHCHLEGSMSPTTVQALAAQNVRHVELTTTG